MSTTGGSTIIPAINLPGTPGCTTSVDVSYGTRLGCGVPMPNGTIEISLICGAQVAHRQTLQAGQETDFACDLPFVKCNFKLKVDFSEGQLFGAGRIDARNRITGEWNTVLATKGDVLLQFDPCAGEVGGRTQVFEPKVASAKYGSSRLATPAESILRFHIEDGDRVVANVGQMVKRRLFPEYRDFVFNTVAAVGAPDANNGNIGRYTDPESPWFNLFLGYYQIDAGKGDGWNRPFGYKSADGPCSEVEWTDLTRLAKCDWNWLSNWSYGTPVEHIAACDAIDRPLRGKPTAEPATIKNNKGQDRHWHRVRMPGLKVASTYQSSYPEAASLAANSILTDAWRWFFGYPCPRPQHPDSFVATELDAEVYLAYTEDDDAYRTQIFGGTVRYGRDRELLDAQLEAIEKVVAENYPDLGWDSPCVKAPVSDYETDADAQRRRITGTTEPAAVT